MRLDKSLATLTAFLGVYYLVYLKSQGNCVHRALSPDIVQFRSACLRTEIFLREHFQAR